MIQTLIFLKLAVAGHLTIFVTRTKGPFWSIPPSPALLWSAVATKVLATLAAVYGVFMVPIGWTWALGCLGLRLALVLLERLGETGVLQDIRPAASGSFGQALNAG